MKFCSIGLATPMTATILDGLLGLSCLGQEDLDAAATLVMTMSCVKHSDAGVLFEYCSEGHLHTSCAVCSQDVCYYDVPAVVPTNHVSDNHRLTWTTVSYRFGKGALSLRCYGCKQVVATVPLTKGAQA